MVINGESIPTLGVFPTMMTVPDCVVIGSNKLGRGHGEAKFYISSKEEMRSFYGKEGFEAKCFMLKKDLIAYMNAIKNEYMEPSQEYARKDDLPSLWSERMTYIKGLPDVISFRVYDQTQIEGPRGYVNSTDDGYKILRKIALPLVSYVYVENATTGFSSVGDSLNPSAIQVRNIWKEHDDLSEIRWLSDSSFSVICYLEDEIFYDIVEINGNELIVTKAITMDWDASEIGNIDHSGERLVGDCTLHVTNNTSDKITFYVYALSFDGNKALPYNELTSSDEGGDVLYLTLEAYEAQDLQVHMTGDKDEKYGDRANNFARGHIYFKIVDVEKGI